MKRFQAVLAAVMALSLAGCVLRGRQQAAKNVPPPPKPASAPAPAAPRQLSVPQTNVQLPPPQPVSPEALAAAPQPAAPAETAPPPKPARRQPGPVGPQPKPEAPPAVQQAPVTPPPQPDAEPQRPALGEIVPVEEQKRLQAAAQEARRATRQMVDQAQARGLSQADQNRVRRIEEFLKLSEEAQTGGNMRQANELAQRGLILARELQVAR
jgi:hypothetical protein